MNRCRKLFDISNVEAIVVVGGSNTYYLSGFESSNCQIVIDEDKQYFITDLRYYNEAVNLLSEDFEVLNGDFETIKKIVSNKKTIGWDSDVPYNVYKKLIEIVDQDKLVDIVDKISNLRSIKTQEEINKIIKAQEITELAFDEALKALKEGVSEIEIAALIEYNFLKRGGMIAFDSIVAFGENGASPHAHRTNRKLKAGDLITMDIGAKWQGYCSDMTRTVAFGNISSEQEKIYNCVLEAQKLAINNIKSEMLCKDADKIARDYINSCGYGEYFTHSLGHGVGIDIHEKVYLSSKNDKDYLKNGMVVTVEPGIYIPNLCGVRIEDTVIIKDNKAISIAKTNKNLIKI